MSAPPSSIQILDIPKILQIIQPGGLLSQNLKGFESRVQQQQMMQNIIESYNQRKIALIEAGTGTGKSVAYLIPALIWAALNKEKTVISTQTIALQEQLLHKDIPLLINALQLDLKAVIVKGMNNYLCLRKAEEAQAELPLFPQEEVKELEKIEAWRQHTQEGSRSDLPFHPSHAVWERVGAESDTCHTVRCPYYQQCYFFKARRQASDAQILIVNHHILFADLVKRGLSESEEAGILPPYRHVIIDEAHHVEEVATEYFGLKVSRLEILRLLARITHDKQEGSSEVYQGKLGYLIHKIIQHYKNDPPQELLPIITRLSIDLPGMRRDLLKTLTDTFDQYDDFISLFASVSSDSGTFESKLRLLPSHKTNPKWLQEVLPQTVHLVSVLGSYAESLVGMTKDLEFIQDTAFVDQIRTTLLDIKAFSQRLQDSNQVLKNFLSDQTDTNLVRWMESHPIRAVPNVKLVEAHLDISHFLINHLFQKFSTVVLCSATLSTNRQFHFVRKRLGLFSEPLKKRVTENIYDSPFDYAKQALFTIPSDLCAPSDPQFMQQASDLILKILRISRGNAFILFTSYGMMRECYQRLSSRLEEAGFYPLIQGELGRNALLSRFKSKNRSVLFGTDSFWEGVDVAGEALRCVIIVKLPFRVPTEPLLEARAEAIIAAGGDPFMDYGMPLAIVKFKQGVGRLIRNQYDRGCVVCLDTRILNKHYGKLFLNSLPNCKQNFAPSEQMLKEMEEFYRRTYYLAALQKK